MKYTIKITKEVPTEEKYPRSIDVYEQSVEVSDSPTMYMTSTSKGSEITPLKVERGANDLVKDVIKAVNQF